MQKFCTGARLLSAGSNTNCHKRTLDYYWHESTKCKLHNSSISLTDFTKTLAFPDSYLEKFFVLFSSWNPTQQPGSFCPRRAVIMLQHLFTTPKASRFIEKETLARVFSCEFSDIFKNIFLPEHLRLTASVYVKYVIVNYRWRKVTSNDLATLPKTF